MWVGMINQATASVGGTSGPISFPPVVASGVYSSQERDSINKPAVGSHISGGLLQQRKIPSTEGLVDRSDPSTQSREALAASVGDGSIPCFKTGDLSMSQPAFLFRSLHGQDRDRDSCYSTATPWRF